jgi:hypothetical protein
MKENEQLEFGLPRTSSCPTIRVRRARGSHWWFAQMRLAVERAPKCGPPQRPTQLALKTGVSR